MVRRQCRKYSKERNINPRILLLIIDGLGVGSMEGESKVNTLKNILDAFPAINIPSMTRMGLLKLVRPGESNPMPIISSFGRCALKYLGADSYAGHQEIMGSIPKKPEKTLFKNHMEKIKSALIRAKYEVEQVTSDMPLIVVNKRVVIGDNLESNPGMIFNVIGSMDEIDYESILQVAYIVRRNTHASRVNAMGLRGITFQQIMDKAKNTVVGQSGIDAASLNAFGEGYKVTYLGYGYSPQQQIASILSKNNQKVTLIGKIADLIECPHASRIPAVDTEKVGNNFVREIRRGQATFVAATVQESDLAGHERNVGKFKAVLEKVDNFVGETLDLLEEDDLFIITADHGNDPIQGTGLHTREFTPLLVKGRQLRNVDLKTRASLADIAATIADYFEVAFPEAGKSFLPLLH